MNLSQLPQKIPFSSPALSVKEQVDLLLQKGLIISDRLAAEQWLSHISYFRFKNYSYSFKDYKNKDGHYIANTRFEEIRDLYLFDRQLKMTVFAAIENIEISVRTVISNVMSTAHGPHWYLDSSHFISEEERRNISRNAKYEDDIPKSFNHFKFLHDLEVELENPTELFLQHYKKHFEPIHPPSWMMMEMITFGTLSIMFENLRPSAEKNSIFDNFQLTKKQLVSWLHCFAFIRNKCAHHARLVYAPIIFSPSMPQRKSRVFLAEADLIYSNTLYAILCCLQYMLNICNDNSSFKMNIVSLSEQFPAIDYVRLGFTPHWRDEKIWR